jgi:hypothetical protein
MGTVIPIWMKYEEYVRYISLNHILQNVIILVGFIETGMPFLNSYIHYDKGKGKKRNRRENFFRTYIRLEIQV